MEKLLIASHNPGKIKEFTEMLSPHSIRVVSSKDYNLFEPIENGSSFKENALLKARAAHQATGFSALADDSGLCVDALNNAPGVYSADWAQTDTGRDYQQAMRRIWTALQHTPNRRAKFVTVLALVLAEGEEKFYEGQVTGHINWPPRGNGGHGYDPIFVPDGETRSFAEMPSGEKNNRSHRAEALQKFMQDLKTEP